MRTVTVKLAVNLTIKADDDIEISEVINEIEYDFTDTTTKATIEDTLNFALDNPFNRVWFNILTPYPGSELFANYYEGQSFDAINWGTFDLSTGILDMNDINKEELFEYQKKAVRKFYFRPAILFDILKHLSVGQFITLITTSFFRKIVGGMLKERVKIKDAK